MKDYDKYTRKLMLWFLIGAIVVFFVCLGLLLYFAITDKQGFNSHTSVSALILSFVSCILTAFFSLATYRNGIIAKESNESNRVNNYIIENYSLINFCTEITIVGQEIDSDMILSDRKLGKGASTNICFLVSKYVNKPIYKILFKEIRFLDKDKKFSSSVGVDSKYQEDTLNRKYDCIAVNLPMNMKDVQKLFYEKAKIEIELEIISIFNVQFTVLYEITLGKKKDTSKNEDTKEYPSLTTYILHHSIYRVEKQNIIEK